MKGALSVAFVTEASAGVGLGHLRRCLALAAALHRHGAVARFVVDGATDALEPGSIQIGWTRVPGLAYDAVAESHPDVVVVDSYHAASELLERLRSVAGCVVAIDDLADRPLPAHLVVNGAFEAGRLPYRGAADTRFLLGSEYALLDPVFVDPPSRSPAGPVRRVLVTLGGGSVGESLSTTVEAVRRAVPSAGVDLALGPLSDDRPAAWAGVTIHRGRPSLRDLMLGADLAVTAGGMTLYQCLASGTPIVGVCLADNQRPNIEGLSRAGLIVGADPSLEEAIRRVAGDPTLRNRMSAEGRRRVDGRGAERVAAEIGRVSATAGAARSAR